MPLNEAVIAEMYSKMNVARVKLQEASVACEDARAFGAAHSATVSEDAAIAAKAAADEHDAIISEICDVYAEALNLT